MIATALITAAAIAARLTAADLVRFASLLGA